MGEFEVIDYNGQTARRYPDGSIRNERGHWLEAHPAGHTITQADASKLVERKKELKYERARAGANRALEALRAKRWDADAKRWIDDGEAWENPQDLDYVEAITEAQTAQALMVGDPSSTRAAEFVFNHTGIGEKQTDAYGQADTPVTLALVQLLGAVTRRLEAADREIIDVDPTQDSGGE